MAGAGATGGMFSGNGDVPRGGGQQIIGGKQYTQYTPQWYDAMDQDKIHRATVAGTAAGSGGKAALTALGGLIGQGGSASGATLGGGSSPTLPRIGGDSGGGGGDFTQFDGGGGTPGVGHIAPIDMTAADAAAFGAAKDKVGQTTSGALTGLRSALAGRGMLGSGAEYRGTQGIVTKGQGELGDTARTQAVNDTAMAADIAKANQASDVTQRGQDVTKRGQNMDYSLGYRAGDITQRGQDINQQTANAQMQMTKSLQEAADRQKILQGIMGVLQGGAAY
jgi:hypothetical protein